MNDADGTQKKDRPKYNSDNGESFFHFLVSMFRWIVIALYLLSALFPIFLNACLFVGIARKNASCGNPVDEISRPEQ
jgi:ATP/ADP translocase